MFKRIRFLLAAFERGEFSEAGLSDRLEHYLAAAGREPAPSRKQTIAGMVPPVVWGRA